MLLPRQGAYIADKLNQGAAQAESVFSPSSICSERAIIWLTRSSPSL